MAEDVEVDRLLVGIKLRREMVLKLRDELRQVHICQLPIKCTIKAQRFLAAYLV